MMKTGKVTDMKMLNIKIKMKKVNQVKVIVDRMLNVFFTLFGSMLL